MQLLNNGKLGKLQWCCIKILVFAKTILYLAVEQFLWQRNFTCAVPLNGLSRCHNYEIMIAGAVSILDFGPSITLRLRPHRAYTRLRYLLRFSFFSVWKHRVPF